MAGTGKATVEKWVPRVAHGGGVEVVHAPAAPEETWRLWIEGDAFPRIVLDVPNFQVLVGDGTAAPTALGGGGGGGASTADPFIMYAAAADTSNEILTSVMIGRGTAAGIPAAGHAGFLYIETDTSLIRRDNGVSWDTVATLPSGPAGGDLTGTYPNPTLAAIGAATGPLGSATRTPTVTIDAKGRVTALTDQAIAIPESAVTNLTTDLAAKLVKASNLSDVASAATSRVNLVIENYTTVNDLAHTITATERVVALIGITAPKLWTLPAANAVNPGEEFTVIAATSAVSSTNKLTVQPAGTDLLNGSNANVVELIASYQIARFVSDGVSKWSCPDPELAAANNLSDLPSANLARNNLLPAQGGNNGKVLGTDGTNVSWVAGGGGGNPAVVSKTFANTPYTAASNDDVILWDASGGACTQNLPTAAGITGKVYTIKRTDNTPANALTVDPAGTETIDGNTTIVLTTQFAVLTVISDGTNWRIV